MHAPTSFPDLLIVGGYFYVNGVTCGIYSLSSGTFMGIVPSVPTTLCNKFASSYDVLFLGGRVAQQRSRSCFWPTELIDPAFLPGATFVHSIAAVPGTRDAYVGANNQMYLYSWSANSLRHCQHLVRHLCKQVRRRSQCGDSSSMWVLRIRGPHQIFACLISWQIYGLECRWSRPSFKAVFSTFILTQSCRECLLVAFSLENELGLCFTLTTMTQHCYISWAHQQPAHAGLTTMSRGRRGLPANPTHQVRPPTLWCISRPPLLCLGIRRWKCSLARLVSFPAR
jgi:hypothetical protein